MAKVLVTEQSLDNAGTALQEKPNTQTRYKPDQFAAAIRSIPTGGVDFPHAEPVSSFVPDNLGLEWNSDLTAQ